MGTAVAAGQYDAGALFERTSLLELQDPNATDALKKNGFLEGDDGDYAVIRAAIQRNRLFLE